MHWMPGLGLDTSGHSLGVTEDVLVVNDTETRKNNLPLVVKVVWMWEHRQ